MSAFALLESFQMSDEEEPDGGMITLQDGRETSKAKRTKVQQEKTKKAVADPKVGGRMCGKGQDKACC